MKFKGLCLFKQMHSNGTPIDSWVIASWHNPESLTWRWTFNYAKFSKHCATGLNYQRTYKYKNGLNGRVLLNLPIIGRWCFEAQPSMFLKGVN
jgi:hypothetical protein